MGRFYIDDSNYLSVINPTVNGRVMRCSYLGMREPFSRGIIESLPRFSEQTQIPVIPERDWDDAIRDAERQGSTLRKLAEDCGMDVLDQEQTNYCWANGPTFAYMLAQLRQTGVPRRFSAASVAARKTNFANVGGWGTMALEQMLNGGINEQDDWPNAAINRRYDTAETRARALLNRPHEIFRAESWEEVGSAIIGMCGVGVGFNWWRHLVCGMWLTIGDHDLDIANSWSTQWGDNGYGTLRGSRKYPDDTSIVIMGAAAA